MAIIGTDLETAESYLNNGEIVAIPTETVYGLSGNATDEKVVTKIFEAKKRPSFDPLIVHFPDLNSVEQWIGELPQKAYSLAKAFWPGPLTLILPKPGSIPYLVTSGLNTVGVRVPRHPLTNELLFELDYPLAAPSANPFGYVSPTTAIHVQQQLGEEIPYILDGGPCTVGVESTIIGFENDRPVIYRLGGTSKEEIENVIGQVDVFAHSTSDPKAPGMLKSHYSPGKKVILGNISENLSKYDTRKTGILSFSTTYPEVPDSHQLELSPSGQLSEAARNLFSHLRRFESMAIDVILAEPVPDEGLGRAINDRLRRASAD